MQISGKQDLTCLYETALQEAMALGTRTCRSAGSQELADGPLHIWLQTESNPATFEATRGWGIEP